MTAPERSRQQRLDALAHGNEIRSYRAKKKVGLKDGTVGLIELLDDPMMRTARLEEILLCLPKVGTWRVRRVMSYARISPSKTMGGLTSRQRDELLFYLARLTPWTPGIRRTSTLTVNKESTTP